MRRKMLLLVLVLGCVFFGAACCEEATPAADSPSEPLPATSNQPAPLLPIDFSGGMPLSPARFTDGCRYQDPTITVEISTGRKDDCDWWCADIVIADASQLRTVSAGGFDSSKVMPGTQLAKRVNAVLAVDGDYYWFTGRGFIVRQGVEYLRNPGGKRDVLLIDRTGDFHAIQRATTAKIEEALTQHDVVNSLFFGPALVIDGEAQLIYDNIDMMPEAKRQRIALCQAGPLHYKAICCASPTRGSVGMTLTEFADLCVELGAQEAYNLDGGDSTMLIFGGEKINDVDNPSTREISDIVYFASAFVPEEEDLR